ncbi:MFS transporter [Puniceicoccales bacterium CK1056]|uniref:MFS transporter n=1 Tax=Oceanipulchritudo coccoides TaxID=2706888 RepID=A0A6B2M1C4_9BACT|nr:MFS transporter [Oceanipulchritudo coccoides]NDV62801.1 MFS transporter [Oceanipulchritudo coccoides]
MKTNPHHQTSPEDRIPLPQKIFYGTGQISNIILALAIVNLAPFVLTVELKVDAFLVGLALGLPRLWDAFTDPVVGYMSDNWRSRWGRRKPFLLLGSVSVGICLMLMWQLPQGWSEMAYFWFFLGMSLIFYLAYTVYATPFVAMGYELTPDYHERTRLMGTMNFIGSLAAIPMAWLFAITQWDIFEDGVQGARVLALGLGVMVIALAMVPITLLKDPTKHRFLKKDPDARTHDGKEKLQFFAGLKTTLKNRNFRMLCFATFSFFPGLILIQNFSSFLVIYYVYGGDNAAASVLLGWSGSLAAFLGVVFIPLVTFMGTHLGKRKAFIVCAGLALFGTLIKWWCYQPSMPYVNLIPGPFIGIGFSALWVLMGSMMADVCDEDELHTGERREGTYSAVFWWIVKLGLSASLATSGLLLNATGFNEDLGASQADGVYFAMRICDIVFPALFISAAIYFTWKFPLTEELSYQIKAELEAKRGKVAMLHEEGAQA